MGTVRAPVGLYAAIATLLAAAACGARSVQLARPDARVGLAGAGAVACLLASVPAALGWPRTSAWGSVAVAACYAAGVGLGYGSDAAAPLVAAGVFLTWELGQLACELNGPSEVDARWLRRRLGMVAGLAAAAVAIGWLALAPTVAGSAGGLALTAAGVIATVAALGLAARLARRSG